MARAQDAGRMAVRQHVHIWVLPLVWATMVVCLWKLVPIPYGKGLGLALGGIAGEWLPGLLGREFEAHWMGTQITGGVLVMGVLGFCLDRLRIDWRWVLLYLVGYPSGVVLLAVWGMQQNVFDVLLFGCFGTYAATIMLLVGGVIWRLWHGKPLQEPRCRGCGYVLYYATDQRCPECGQPFTREEIPPQQADW